MAALGAIQSLHDLFFMDSTVSFRLSNTDNSTRSNFLVSGNNVPGTETLVRCNNSSELFKGCAVVIVSETHYLYGSVSGHHAKKPQYAIPFKCIDISGDNVILETDTDVFKKTNMSTIKISKGTQIRTTIPELNEYASQNNLYCENRKAAFEAAPEAPAAADAAAAAAPMRLRDLSPNQLLAMQNAHCPDLYNLKHEELVPVMDANPNIRFVIRKGSNQAALSDNGRSIKKPSKVLVHYIQGQLVKTPLYDDKMLLKLSELFPTDEEKSNSRQKKQAKAENKAILNDIDTNNYGSGLVAPASRKGGRSKRSVKHTKRVRKTRRHKKN